MFSGFNKEINIDDVMKYPQPYADGYRGFWKNPLTIQHPMAEVEMVVWDGICVLIISDDDRIVQKVKSTTKAEDLKEYNNK